MPRILADTRVRASLAELGELFLDGSPSTATLTYLSNGQTAEWETPGELPVVACPDLVTVEWEFHGIKVKAEIDVVARRYCTIEDIKAYRPDEYQLAGAPDEDAWSKRQRAEEKIERAAHRFFQPVMRRALIERTNCTAARIPVFMGEDCAPRDLTKVTRAEYVDGGTATVRVMNETALDVRDLDHHRPATAAVVMGMRSTPEEMHDAVVALAAFYLLPKVGPDNTTSESTEAGTVLRFVVGGVDGAATSLPEVNAVIDAYGFTDYKVW